MNESKAKTFGGTFAFFSNAQSQNINTKEPPSQRIGTPEIIANTTEQRKI
ncbi:MAG: hypothetical protein SGI96_13690 [Bacteroidota bacterium]|nr:hypothetical protein [Bacteroidota bacterium]